MVTKARIIQVPESANPDKRDTHSQISGVGVSCPGESSHGDSVAGDHVFKYSKPPKSLLWGLRPAIKTALYVISTVLAAPFFLAEKVAKRIFNQDVFLSGQGELFSLLPGTSGTILRNAYYHQVLDDCPFGVCLQFGSLFSHSEVELGNRVYIGLGSSIGMCSIGADTMVADHVQILSGSGQHFLDGSSTPFQDIPAQFEKISIGRNSWIGARCIVMADIGDNCIIGAGSIVTRPIPSNSVAYGSPARVIRTFGYGTDPSSNARDEVLQSMS